MAPHHRPVYPEHFASQYFHMETPQSVLHSIRQGDWMISLDLQDAYLQVPVHPESLRYLRFTMRGVPYQFRVLCFGLTTAPQVFTRLMAPISAILHRYGIRMLRYLDDWLILAESRTTCLQARDRLLQVCEELVLQVNFRKSSLVPSQDMTYLGMQILSVRFIAKPTDEGSESPQHHRGVSFVPGPPSSSLEPSSGPPFVPYSSGKGWDATDAISPNSPQVQVGLSGRVTSHLLLSSVSGGSFMVVLGDSTRRGRRSFSPSARLELLLGRVRRRLGRHSRGTKSVRSLDSKPKGTFHQPQGDDGSAERSLTVQLSSQRQDDRSLLRQCHDSRLPQAMGGTRSQVLFLKAREILLWVESMKITLLPQFIQGSLNTREDLLSRPNLVIGSEWTLHQEVVQDLLHQWPAIIDLFATSLTARLPVFFAPAWEPKAAGVDAFLQPWDNLQAYAFPPIAIIRRVLLKLRASHHCDLTLIAPFWPQREWFPDPL